MVAIHSPVLVHATHTSTCGLKFLLKSHHSFGLYINLINTPTTNMPDAKSFDKLLDLFLQETILEQGAYPSVLSACL